MLSVDEQVQVQVQVKVQALGRSQPAFPMMPGIYVRHG